MTRLRHAPTLGLSGPSPVPGAYTRKKIMQIRQDSSGRVQPTEGKYLAEPGTCAICGKSPDNMEEVFANPVVELEQYGYIYFCLNCCAEIGNFVCMIPHEQMEMLALERDMLKRSFLNATNENEYLRGLLDARISAAGSGESDFNGPASVPVPETEPVTTEFDYTFDGIEPVLSESGSDN